MSDRLSLADAYEKLRWAKRHAETLERIDRLFDAEQALDPDAERVRAKLRPLERRESQLDHQIDAIEDADDERSSRDEARLGELRREMRDLEAQMRVLEREEEEIDRRRDAREAEAERRMVPILEDAIHSGIARPAAR